MKKVIIICILFFSIKSFSQEVIGRRYTLYPELIFCKSENSKLLKESFKIYHNLPKDKRDQLDLKLKLLEEGLTKELKFTDANGTELIITPELVKSYNFRNIIAMKDTFTPDFIIECDVKKFKGSILFENDKIYVNPWNFTDDKCTDDESELYFQLKDGQTAKLHFKELTLSTFALPLKIRFGGKPNVRKQIVDEETMGIIQIDTLNNIDATFSTAVNVALFFGQSYGKTNLHHRKKVGNVITSHKHTFGTFIGTSAEKLAVSNTDGTLMKSEFEDRTIGLISLGGGYVYSRNKFGIGLFLGWDFGLGAMSKVWDYNGRLYLGIGLGIDVFKIQP